MPPRTRLDQTLITKIAERTEKSEKSVREQISRKASSQGISSEAAQVVWAKSLGIGTARALARLEPHQQEQVRAGLPIAFAAPASATGKSRRASPNRSGRQSANPVQLAVEYLITDDELKSRCSDLLQARKHYDRPLREATTILDDRLKRLTGIEYKINPVDLVNKVLNPKPDKAVLVVSDDPAEQEGINNICKGLMLAFRNQSHHQLDDKITQRDALKLCGLIDTLLDILGKAKIYHDRV